jgi:8-oxo-dGTP pyrophosphatase MutT (NUDIX family)
MPAVYRNGVAVVIVCRQSLPVGHPLRGDCDVERCWENAATAAARTHTVSPKMDQNEITPAKVATGTPTQAISGAAPIVPAQLRFLCGQRTDMGEPWHFVQGGIELEDAGLTEADIHSEPNPSSPDSAVNPMEKRVGDAITIAAAYREAYEEIGLRAEHLTLVGPIQGPPAPTAEAIARGDAVICGVNIPAGDTTTAAAALSRLLPVPNFAFRFNWIYEKQGRCGQQHYPVLFLADESVTAHCKLSVGAGDRQEFQQVAWLTAEELMAVAERDKLPMLSAMTNLSTAQLLAFGGGQELVFCPTTPTTDRG